MTGNLKYETFLSNQLINHPITFGVFVDGQPQLLQTVYSSGVNEIYTSGIRYFVSRISNIPNLVVDSDYMTGLYARYAISNGETRFQLDFPRTSTSMFDIATEYSSNGSWLIRSSKGNWYTSDGSMKKFNGPNWGESADPNTYNSFAFYMQETKELDYYHVDKIYLSVHTNFVEDL